MIAVAANRSVSGIDVGGLANDQLPGRSAGDGFDPMFVPSAALRDDP
jgi:hypothetical protein